MTTNNVDKSVGSVTYTLLLDETGGIRSDLTVARLARRPASRSASTGRWTSTGSAATCPPDVTLRDITGGTCCIGVWGPLARDMVAPLCPDDLSHEEFKYFRALQTYLDAVPVTMLRVSYVGELGWEIYASAEYGAALWDLLFEAGQRHDVIAAGRIAFNSLRIEKGYRLWGTDMTAEHQPAAAGVDFAVRMNKEPTSSARRRWSGRPRRGSCCAASSSTTRPPSRWARNRSTSTDRCVGYVTSAGYSATDRAQHRLRLAARRHRRCGDTVTVDYRGTRYERHRARRARRRPRDDPDQEVAQMGYDVIVIGLGGMGSAAAYHLAARGQRVLGLEKFTPAHDKGSSHGGSRIIRQSYFEDPAYVPLLLRAYELWDKLATDTGREVYRLTGGLFIGPPDCLTVAGSRRASREWDPAARDARRGRDPPPIPDFHPVSRRHRPVRGEGRVRTAGDDGAGAHRPRRAARAPPVASARKCSSGARTAAGVTVTTARGTYTAGQLVICPGAWAPQAARRVRHPDHHRTAGAVLARPRRRDCTVRRPSDLHRRRRRRHAGLRVPRDRRARRRCQGGVLPQGHSLHAGDHRPRGARPRDRRDACARRRAACRPSTGRVCTPRPACTPTPPTSTSSSPVTRTRENITVACGFSGHGFKFVPVVGEILADLAIDGATGHPISLFDPKRLVTDMTTVDHPDPARPAQHARRGLLRQRHASSPPSRNTSSRACGSVRSGRPISRRPESSRRSRSAARACCWSVAATDCCGPS